MFQKKLENSLAIKILQQIFIEYKHMIQYCLDICIEFIDFMVTGKKVYCIQVRVYKFISS